MTPTVVSAQWMPPGTPDVPVAIVGAGACGLTAALMLRDAGIDCVLVSGQVAYRGGDSEPRRNGRFLPRESGAAASR